MHVRGGLGEGAEDEASRVWVLAEAREYWSLVNVGDVGEEASIERARRGGVLGSNATGAVLAAARISSQRDVRGGVPGRAVVDHLII